MYAPTRNMNKSCDRSRYQNKTNRKPYICTVYPKKYAHGFVVLCFVVVMQSFIMNSHEVFIHIHQGCFAGTGAIVRLPQCQWSKPDGYGKISQCITTTKHSKAKTVCIFLGIYCIYIWKNIVILTIAIIINSYNCRFLSAVLWCVQRIFYCLCISTFMNAICIYDKTSPGKWSKQIWKVGLRRDYKHYF